MLYVQVMEGGYGSGQCSVGVWYVWWVWIFVCVCVVFGGVGVGMWDVLSWCCC